jgi:hypothetical protein
MMQVASAMRTDGAGAGAGVCDCAGECGRKADDGVAGESALGDTCGRTGDSESLRAEGRESETVRSARLADDTRGAGRVCGRV